MEPRTPAEWKTLFESEAFARQTEYYGPLGVEYTPAGTHLRLWAPTAKQAAVNLYRRGTGGACVGTLPLQQQDKGVWSIYLPGDQHGKYYDFTLTTPFGTCNAADPYARSAGVNGVRSMIFDPAQPVRFSTYGVPMIIGEIRRFLRDNNALRVSRSLRDAAYKAMQARETLEKQLGREPTVDEVARQAGLSRREVNAALESVVEPISLEEPLYTDGGDAMYVIDQVRDPDSEDSWISGLEFRQTVAGLTPREKRIMELRYLKGETQMEVAREIGISQAQVSRLEKAALEQFRHK